MEGPRGALYGGPSYQYSYQELDPTELQYLRAQGLQESQQFQHLGQSNYQVNQSYSQSYWQKYHRPSLQGMIRKGVSSQFRGCHICRRLWCNSRRQ